MERALMAQPLLMERHLISQQLEELQAEYNATNGLPEVRLAICELFLDQCRIDQELLSLIPESCESAFIYN